MLDLEQINLREVSQCAIQTSAAELRILSFTKAVGQKLHTEAWKKWHRSRQLSGHRNSEVFLAIFDSIKGIVIVSVYTKMSEG